MEIGKDQGYFEKLRELETFWDDNAAEYSRATRDALSHGSGLSGLLRKMLPEIRRLRVLDIGTGAGYVAITLAKMGHDVTAVDISGNMLEYAKANASIENVEVRFVKGDVHDALFPDGSFDLVVARDVLFNLARPSDAVTNWVRCLCPGGRIIILDGNYFYYKLDEYRKRREYFRTKEGLDEFQMRFQNSRIDFDRLQGIVRPLSVNNMRRPGWETWVLMGLGLSEIRIYGLDTEKFYAMTSAGRLNVPLTYAISARVPEPEVPGSGSNIADPKSMRSFVSGLEPEDFRLVTALSSMDRVRIVYALSNGSLDVSDLSFILGIPQNSTSYHLRILSECGVIRMEKRGRESYYRLVDPDRMGSILSDIRSFRD